MPIPESQLDTWSAIGSITQSSQTYQTIKLALEANDTPYAGKANSFLQGSYGNDTNVYADSDVDVVIQYEWIYYYDISRMNAAEQERFKAGLSDTSYSFNTFRDEVTGVLKKRFAADAVPDKKVIWIKPNAGRRNTDVLPVVKFRRYYKLTGSPSDFTEGLCFWPNGGSRVENFPKQHSANLTAKHQSTGNRLKPMVRIWKNLRNRMVEDGVIAEGTAPSYCLEGLLYNVPDDKFVNGTLTTFVNCYQWVMESKKEDLVCANRMFWLLRENEATSWSPKKFDNFMLGIQTTWSGW